MTRSEVRTFIESGVNALTPPPEFGYGRISEFNSLRSHEYPAVWQITSPVSTELGNGAPTDSWTVDLIIAQIDKQDSSAVEYEHILDDCDIMAQKLIYKYRNDIAGYKLVTMESVEREPFVKKYADCLTGVNLRFIIISPNQENVC